ncbi:MAG: hypothetical protein WB780_07230 [Candidatus Acidiferrales bacterium]
MKTICGIRARGFYIAACLAVAFFHAAGASAQDAPKTEAPNTPEMEADPAPPILETGFRYLYELNFKGAREQFLSYQKIRPDDPLGKSAEAASYLFEEFNAKGVLTSEFFLNDDRFLGGLEGKPSENRNKAFLDANHQAHDMAKKALKQNSHDTHALLVLTMTDGLESNYAAMIEKKQLPALSLMRQAESESNALLAIDPNAMDAYVALGMSNYVIGCLPSFKRAFLWFGGVHGDRVRGMQQMKSAAEGGHYFQPFAKILLALAYEREHQKDRAQPLLAELSAQFPTNPIFAHELALVARK